MKIAVFASGRGTNLAAIIKAKKKGIINAEISLVVSDNKKALALKKAQRAGIKAVFIDPLRFLSKQEFEAEIIKALEAEGIDLIALAGFMRILSTDFVIRFKNKIINIHPAILPSFKGAHGINEAFDYGVKVTGVTVHFVDEAMDHGPIILQKAVSVDEKDTLETLESKIHKVEHKIYPEAIRLFVEGRLRIEGRKVYIA
ncbi:MAG: phosphoribosylglycinamide formyltransferase [Candidatus Omnitrophica bacterium]|nr:phosphoribosylglycinamide formyltransferase [Candidatus Omnitrophota bacterium]